jgi:hypothetical protein
MDIDERYTRGKIYKIVCKETDEVYYGSTIQKLNKRMNEHRVQKVCRSRQILDRNNYFYELVENYSCNNRQELETRERWYIENNDCINKQIPTRTKKEYRKLYDENNKQKQKEYKQNNIEQISKYHKKWYETNKERILKHQQEKINCPICGSIVSRGNMSLHKKTKKCLSKIEKLNTKTI